MELPLIKTNEREIVDGLNSLIQNVLGDHSNLNLSNDLILLAEGIPYFPNENLEQLKRLHSRIHSQVTHRPCLNIN